MERVTTNDDCTTVTEGTAFKAIVDMHPERILVVGEDGKVFCANASASGLLSRLAGAGNGLPGAISVLPSHSPRLTLSGLTGCEGVLAVRTQSIQWVWPHRAAALRE